MPSTLSCRITPDRVLAFTSRSLDSQISLGFQRAVVGFLNTCRQGVRNSSLRITDETGSDLGLISTNVNSSRQNADALVGAGVQNFSLCWLSTRIIPARLFK